MTDELLTPSQRAREAAETIRRGIGGKYDREHTRALQAFARFERDLTAETRETALREALLIIFTEWEAYVLPDSDGFPDDPCAVINDAWKNGFYEKARAALAGGEG